ncbi:MAG: ABC transporter permease [Deltaproteobacteria bacterium]|nr:ABC transporter permease [Deltaproteobacteria bacterium]
MRNVWWIVRRELGSYLRSPAGYIIIFAVLVLDGLLFNAFAIGAGAKKSSEVLEHFFYFSSGSILVGSVFVSMRLIAEERQTGTLALLATSPVAEWQLILGKYVSALTFLAVMTGLTFYMPILVMVNGKVSLAHILAGYFGLLLIGGAALALGMVASALAPNQLVAAVLAATAVVVFLLLWLLSRIASPPIDTLVAYLSLHDKHFRPFMRGIISIQDVVFYVSLIYVSLLVATRVLEARRWR